MSNQRERLMALHDLLTKEPDSYIHLGNFRFKHNQVFEKVTDEEVLQHRCGTSACAVGVASAHPWFIKQGLVTDDISNYPVFESWLGMDACEKFFELTPEDNLRLFGPRGSYDTVYFDADKAQAYEKSLTDLYPYTWLREQGVSERQIVMMRIRNYLLSHDLITQQRADHMKKFEVAHE